MDIPVEIQNFIRVWFAAIGALCFCYYFLTRIPSGILRLLFVLPIVYFFLILPLDLSSFHLGAPTIFYLVWLANFKLLLFCFDQGPLSSYSSLPLLHFLSIALLPVRAKHVTRDDDNNNRPSVISQVGFEKNSVYADLTSTLGGRETRSSAQEKTPKSKYALEEREVVSDKHVIRDNNNKSTVIPQVESKLAGRKTISDRPLIQEKTFKSKYILEGKAFVSNKHVTGDGSRISTHSGLIWVKLILLGAIIWAYNYRELLHSNVILVLYCLHVFLAVELILGVTVVPVRALLGLEIETQFNDPYLATSLQDFWGRRWNLMVPGILRPAVFFPVRAISTRVLGKELAILPAIFATFLVSGLMHELIYYYLSRAGPTWEVTWFFVLHGICVCVEVTLKKVLGGGWQINRVVSGVLTLGFVAWTGDWLFFPQIIRYGLDQKAINEYYVLVGFFKDRLLPVLRF
ncbi:long-chain-alcohol O-fatty-acyltransferase-like [Lycium barbarum]|uniref:long-chain-alcohol O-fatty-acyltransferase-like n=1 Tax=Lycium barbarum TaxID=112863 RepID=UPI00293E71A8|nr:long-chain-alcohol O-fatty-acyltransferase-like [Lycium barbarum]